MDPIGGHAQLYVPVKLFVICCEHLAYERSWRMKDEKKTNFSLAHKQEMKMRRKKQHKTSRNENTTVHTISHLPCDIDNI